MAQTMAEYVKAEGMRIGLEEGVRMAQHAKEEGIEIGQRRTAQQALSIVLTARFGELPPAVTQAIEAAETEELTNWLTLAATAASLEAVGIQRQQ